MSNFFIDRPIFATVLAIVITLAGLIAFLLLPVARFPQITPPSVVVSATFPGADASTIEQSVAAPIETQVNGVPNMIYMDSRSSNDGSYTLNVTFEVGTAQDIAAVDVQNQVAIAQRQLPPDVLRQGVSITKRQPQPLIFVAIEATDPALRLPIPEQLRDPAGVRLARARSGGGSGAAVRRARLRHAHLARPGQDVAPGRHHRRHQQRHQRTERGRAGRHRRRRACAARTADDLHGHRARAACAASQEFENVVLKAGPNGSIVRLRDVARIELAATDYTRSSRLNGKPVALLGVYQLPDANALEVSKKVRATLEQLSQHFPPGIRYSIPLDTSEFVRESIREVEITLFIAAALVLLVVFMFLESWRATLIPMLAVPVSLLGTFTVFVALGFSINTLTLFALVLAIGLVVDDAIVVVEAVTEKMEEKGLDPLTATRAAMARRVESGHRHCAGAHGGVRAGGFSWRADRPVLQTVRADAVGVGSDFGVHRAHLHAGAVRAAAEAARRDRIRRAARPRLRRLQSSCSTRATKRYTDTVRHAIRRSGDCARCVRRDRHRARDSWCGSGPAGFCPRTTRVTC